MVECHYRSNVGSDATLSVWFHVRLYKNGRVWIRAIVENGYLDAPKADKTYLPTVTIGGTVVYNNSGTALTHYAYTRWSSEGWIGGDPSITPKHNSQYLIDTKLVPNYWKRSPSSAALNGLTQTYTPMGKGDHTLNMGGTGFQKAIGILPLWDALYVTSTDSRAYRSVLANSSSLNSYPIVWRDSTTKLAARPTDWPNFSINSGTYSYSAGGLTWEMNHEPSEGYLAYLISGDYWHYETMLLHTALNYLARNNSSGGSGATRIITAQTRGVAWFLRTISQLAGLAPSGDAVAADYQSLLSANMTHWKSKADASLTANRRLGYLYSYSAGGQMNAYGIEGVDAPWMHHFFAQAVGNGSDLEPLSTMTTYNAVRDWIYQGPVGIAGDSSGFCFTFASNYSLKLSSGINLDPTTWYSTWAEVYSGSQAIGLISGGVCGNTLGGSSGGHPSSAPTGYWGNYLPSIAYAVEHGAPGAAAAWARLTGASNWSTIEGSGFDDIPIWGIVPRTGTTVSTPPPSPPTNLTIN
jgi:hypothetical protein